MTNRNKYNIITFKKKINLTLNKMYMSQRVLRAILCQQQKKFNYSCFAVTCKFYLRLNKAALYLI